MNSQCLFIRDSTNHKHDDVLWSGHKYNKFMFVYYILAYHVIYPIHCITLAYTPKTYMLQQLSLLKYWNNLFQHADIRMYLHVTAVTSCHQTCDKLIVKTCCPQAYCKLFQHVVWNLKSTSCNKPDINRIWRVCYNLLTSLDQLIKLTTCNKSGVFGFLSYIISYVIYHMIQYNNIQYHTTSYHHTTTRHTRPMFSALNLDFRVTFQKLVPNLKHNLEGQITFL